MKNLTKFALFGLLVFCGLNSQKQTMRAPKHADMSIVPAAKREASPRGTALLEEVPTSTKPAVNVRGDLDLEALARYLESKEYGRVELPPQRGEKAGKVLALDFQGFRLASRKLSGDKPYETCVIDVAHDGTLIGMMSPYPGTLCDMTPDDFAVAGKLALTLP